MRHVVRPVVCSLVSSPHAGGGCGLQVEIKRRKGGNYSRLGCARPGMVWCSMVWCGAPWWGVVLHGVVYPAYHGMVPSIPTIAGN